MGSAIVTLQIAEKPNHDNIIQRTEPTVIDYARRHGHEYVVLRERKFPHLPPQFEKYQLRDLIKQYDRVCYFDTDLLIAKECPDLFHEVPEHSVGCYNTVRHPRWQEAVEEVRALARLLGFQVPSNWEGFHFNTGLMVLSHHHHRLFDLTNEQLRLFRGQYDRVEQPFINATALGRQIPCYFIHEKFHWLLWQQRNNTIKKPYIVHFASIYPQSERLRQIDHMLGIWADQGRLPECMKGLRDEAGIPIWEIQRYERKRLRQLEHRRRQADIDAALELGNS